MTRCGTRSVGLLGAIALALPVLLVGSPASAVVGFAVDTVTYSPSPLTVDGLATAPLTVSAHVTDGSALSTSDGYLSFELQRSTGTGWQTLLCAPANLVSGDGSNGTWRAVFAVPSGAAGAWTLASIGEGSSCTGTVPFDAEHAVTGAPTVVVTGTNQPRISAGIDPSAVRYPDAPFLVKGRLYNSSTGVGIPGATVSYQIEADEPYCGAIADWPAHVVTNAGGYFSFPAHTSLGSKVGLNCVAVLGGGAVPGLVVRSVPVTVQGWVSATAVTTNPPADSAVTVNGAMSASLCAVQLQQLFGATAWRTVSSAVARVSGRLTVLSPPIAAGPATYRLFQPVCVSSPGIGFATWAAASSRPFTITGT